jgi:hypothetical protein
MFPTVIFFCVDNRTPRPNQRVMCARNPFPISVKTRQMYSRKNQMIFIPSAAYHDSPSIYKHVAHMRTKIVLNLGQQDFSSPPLIN